MKKIIFLIGLISIFSCSNENSREENIQKPNILLIMVDDMGFADLGSFGSEIPTPTLDELSDNGVKFSQFITSSVCSPTRASLLTGLSPHKAGFGNLTEELAPNQLGQPGYEGFIPHNVKTLPERLKVLGYTTMMAGKWHLGRRPEDYPYRRGFEQSFSMLKNASHFRDMKPAYSPSPDAKALYTKNGELLSELPDNFNYSTEFYVDETINQIRQADKGKPFFSFLSFSAPHWPLQAPKQSISKFYKLYKDGYDVIASERLAKQKTLGLIPKNAKLAPRLSKGKPWGELSELEQKVEIKAMAIYAAMVYEIDKHTNRLIQYLKNNQLLDNTVIIFMSDNGAEGHDLDDTWPRSAFPDIRKVIDSTHDFSYENMGGVNSYTFYGPNWARASAPAFNGHKGSQNEGGKRTAAFIYSPKLINAKGVIDDYINVKDITASILDWASVNKKSNWQQEIEGVSIIDRLNNENSLGVRVHVDETMGKISVRKGPWKLVKTPEPNGDNQWNLFNLDKDLSESTNLASNNSEKVDELLTYWDEYQRTNKVVLPNWVSGY